MRLSTHRPSLNQVSSDKSVLGDEVALEIKVVRYGWALAYRRYSKDYVSVEKEAQDHVLFAFFSYNL
jgi:hypothetical protein